MLLVFVAAVAFISGAAFAACPHPQYYEAGPYGGLLGINFNDDGVHQSSGCANITQIILYYDERIAGIQVTYGDVQGTLNGNQNNLGCGTSGCSSTTINLLSDEYIISVNGSTANTALLTEQVAQLSFITNRRVWGPYGQVGVNAIFFDATPPGYPSPGLAYISGRGSRAIDALSFHFVIVR